MNTSDYYKNYTGSVRSAIDAIPVNALEQIIEQLDKARRSRATVYIFGNGGSAATASHFASDLAKGAQANGKPGLRTICLSDNFAVFTAWANDSGYDNVFSAQLENLVQPGDIAIGISGSGNSHNVLKGIHAARGRGIVTVGITGFDGGKLKDIADIPLAVPNNNMEQVEDIHMLLCHFITSYLREVI